jgi:hypothetical protein
MYTTHIGNHRQEELAKFGYWSERKLNKFKHLAGTYCLNVAIPEEKKIPRNLSTLVHFWHEK